MNTNNITEALNSNNVTKAKFKGVFASNRLPKSSVIKPSFYIANTDPSYKSGQHWVAFYFPKNKPAEFFCPAGEPPIKPFISFLNKNSETFIYNKRRIQSESSILCGVYCCIFIYLRCKNLSFNNIINIFNYYNLYENDLLILHLFKYFNFIK